MRLAWAISAAMSHADPLLRKTGILAAIQRQEGTEVMTII